MTKSTKWHVRPAKTKLAWASAQSDQSLRCVRQMKAWADAQADQSSLGAHAILLVLSCACTIFFQDICITG